MSIISKVLDVCRENTLFQEYINSNFNDATRAAIERKYLDTACYERKGNKYIFHELLSTIEQAEDYDTSDIRSTDIVLDLGACIGGFSIPISRKVKRVYAVEPIYDEGLQKNINLNEIKNIDVLKTSLGDGSFDSIKFGYRSISTITRSFQEILRMCGGHVDILKCDVEGAEWHLQKIDLAGIRRIEMELHLTKKHDRTAEFTNMLEEAGFMYVGKQLTLKTFLISATRINNGIIL